MSIRVLIERCPQNHHCPALKVCPVKALDQVENQAPTVNKEKCINCGLCANFCPMRALILEK